MSNNEIALWLREQARALRLRHENLFRVKAFRLAADAVQRLTRPIEELDRNTLAAVPGIGRKLAVTIESLARDDGK